jgi:DNA-binding NtrC family response regulator
MARDPRHHDDTERDHVDRASDTGCAFRIAVIDGPDAGKAIEVGPAAPAPVLLGKSAACELVLADARVSRRHVSLEASGGALRVLDLTSTNGTQVNGVRVADASLRGGELLRIGDTTLRVELLDARAKSPLWPVESFGRLLGSSVSMRRMYPLLQKLAASTLPLVIEGETGTGKELCAESIHEMGPRKAAPFVVFDCAAHGTKQLEAVLFGEQEPAREGLFEQANGGTLLVDEIAELPLVLQAKLLRVLDRGEFSRVHGDGWLHADVRVITTTRQNLEREVERGRFREDLYFRIAAARIALPPLRDRANDAPLLAQHFWTQVAGAGDRAMPSDLLEAYGEGYAWPGNVRELRHVVLRKAALGDSDDEALATSKATGALGSALYADLFDAGASFSSARAQVIAEFEKSFVERVLAKHGGNVSRAAAASGIARRYFQILRTRHGRERGG